MATFPSDSVRTKNWGTEILTDADLEGQLDVIHDYVKAQLDGSTGHNHDGTSNQSKKLTSAAIGATFISGLTTVTGVSTDYLMIADASDSNAPKKALASDFLSPSPPVGASSNLVIIRPSATTVDIDADSIILKTSGGLAYEATAVNLTANITSSGVNGLDTGAEGNVWYYIWVIYNGTTVSSLLSASSTIGTITLPGGYTYGALVGAVHNTSGDFVDFIQSGKKYMYVAEPTVASGSFGTSWTTTDITAFVPSALSNFVYFHCEGSTSDALYMTNDSSVSAAYGTSARNRVIHTAATAVRGTFFCAFPILTANTVYLAANGTLYCVGFDITKL